MNRRGYGSLETEGGDKDRPPPPALEPDESMPGGVPSDTAGRQLPPLPCAPPEATSRSDAFGSAPSASAGGLHEPISGVPTESEFARALVARIIAGDRTAEDLLVRTYERGIRKVLQHLGQSDWDLAELTQDTWATALQKIRGGELREPAALGAFLCGIARGKASNRRRAILAHPTASDPAQIDELLSESDGPDRVVGRVQDKELVWNVLRLMRPRDRAALIHFVLLDEDKDEVCAGLGISPARFHGILCRAKQRFHKLLLTTVAGKEMERRR